MSRQLSLAVVGADHPNRDKSNRRFEILLCLPGEPVRLMPEPRNPVDPHAMAVFSARGIQIGYLTAERAPWIGGMVRNGREIRAIFQQATAGGAIIRAAFDGLEPVLPPAPACAADSSAPDDAFDGIDPIYPDE
ncbi:HIRAN domain-containing protein [Flavisphingomonas formosensis]|uniref:HIRAN domain-containing protein n=1 Tax=Flavisphingomonas formosensis TaxID=861534 RepID=UPI0012FCAA1E|nr:HIRAN domain-containing protein [Sphingomonas formosensis]